MNRVLAEYYPKHALLSLGRHERRSYSSRRLHEDDGADGGGSEAQSYGALWLEAMDHLSEKQNQCVDLPPDSSERLRVEALVGLLHKYKIPDGGASNDQLRQMIDSFANDVEAMTGEQDTELGQYAAKFVYGLRTLHNQIQAGNDDVMGPAGDEEGDKEGGDKPAKPEGGEGEEPVPGDEGAAPPPKGPEREDLAKSLGVAAGAGAPDPNALPAAPPRAHESIRMRRSMRGRLHEDYSTVGPQQPVGTRPYASAPSNDRLEPGQQVYRNVDGKLVPYQVVKHENDDVSVIDPEKADQVQRVRRDEVVTELPKTPAEVHSENPNDDSAQHQRPGQ